MIEPRRNDETHRRGLPLGLGHTPRFWSIIRANTSTMEKARTWLKDNGQVLEQEL